MNLNILVLNIGKLSYVLRWRSKIFNLVIVDGEEIVWNKMCFVFRRRMLSIFRVEYEEGVTEINFKRYLEFFFSIALQKKQSFFSYVSLIDPVKARHALYWIDCSFSLNNLLETWLYRHHHSPFVAKWKRCI